ncbi:MAG: hypothetical protein IH984_09710 [Planctomycetes bacterium]|nr:hypothetical protein [Planctomycetota bacterium]
MSEDKQQQPQKKKPWYRLRNIILVIVLAIFSWPTYILIWALNVKPNPSIDYALQMQRLSIDSQPEGDNAWPLLMDAVSILKKIEESLLEEGQTIDYFSQLDFNIIYETDVDESELTKLNIALKQMKSNGVFNLLAQAATCQNAVRPPLKSDTGPLIFALLPEIRDLQLLARARIASMHLAIVEGNSHEAIVAFDQVLYIAKALTHQHTIIDQLVGQRIALEACKRLRNAIKDRDIDQLTLSGFLESSRRHLPLGPLSMNFEAERLSLLDTIQYTFSDNGNGNGRLLLSQFDDVGIMNIVSISNPSMQPYGGREAFPAIYNAAGIVYADRKETIAIVDRYYKALINRSKMSRRQRMVIQFDESQFMQLDWRHPIPKFMIPALASVINKRDVADCQIAGTILMLAIEEYRAANEQYPTTLENLVPEFLQEIPNDPFSEQGFVYRITTNSQAKQTYLLYSIGIDGKDNNGKINAEKEDDAFSIYEGNGLDFSFNPARPGE